MTFDDQFWLAVADYGVMMPALGAANVTWLTEYQRVRTTALAAVLIMNQGSEGGSAGGGRQFPQETLLNALFCHRFDLDPTYVLPPHLAAYPAMKIRRANQRPGSIVLRFDNAS